MSIQYQVVKRGAETWEITAVRALNRGGDAHEYELIGRVTRPFGESLYWAEISVWHAVGNTWVRQPRGYALPEPAFNAVRTAWERTRTGASRSSMS